MGLRLSYYAALIWGIYLKAPIVFIAKCLPVVSKLINEECHETD